MHYADLTTPINSDRVVKTGVKECQQMLTFARLATDGTWRQRGRGGS